MKKVIKWWGHSHRRWCRGIKRKTLSFFRNSLGLPSPNVNVLGSSFNKHTISSSNTLHNQTLAFQVMTSWHKSEVYGLQRKMMGLGRLLSHLQWIIKCLQRKHPSSKLSQWVGYGIHSIGFMPPWRPKKGLFLHKYPPSKVLQRQVNSPTKGLKSYVSCQVNHI